MEIPYLTFSGHVEVLKKNYSHSVSLYGSWSESFLISQSDDLIITTIEMKNYMKSTLSLFLTV